RIKYLLIKEVSRSLRRDFIEIVGTLVILAAGIATATTTLSAVYGTFVRPLSYPNADRIVELSQVIKPGYRFRPFTYRFFMDARSSLPGMRDLAAVDVLRVIVRGERRFDPASVDGVACSYSLFNLIRAWPTLGRPLTQADEQTEGSVAVISDELWHSLY